MFIPEKLLLALTELLSESDEHPSETVDWQCTGFKSNESTLCCWLSNPANEAWYFHPVGFWSCVSKSTHQSTLIDWKLNEPLTESVRKSIASTVTLRVPKELFNHFGVISCESIGNVLVARCGLIKLVARTLQTWGDPPESVVRDWQIQLASHTKSLGQPSTSETFISDDGWLVPLTIALSQIASTDKGLRSYFDKRPVSNLERISVPSPAWLVPPELRLQVRMPKPTEQATATTLGIDNSGLWGTLAESNSRSASACPARKREKKALTIQVVTVVGAIAILTACIWLISPTPKSAKPKFANSINAERLLIANSPNSWDSNVSDIVELESTVDLTTFLAGHEKLSSESGLETLLTQLKKNGLDSFSASSIVTGSMTQASPTLATDDIEEMGEESNDLIKPVDANSIRFGEGIVTLERPLRLQTASMKETVVIGKTVLAKASRCEIEWKLADKVVIEPVQKVSIDGNGKASWRIAIEDEDPELVVEITSKPGARWQLLTTVGLRECPNTIPILIGPRDAQIVGNRLIDYRQWLMEAVETLRTLRSNYRGRNGIDWPGEIKKLEYQKREAEKAIDRWKVVARLCHYFFDSNEARIQFTAVEKR